MPLKIQNYGDWDGETKRGHHPPNCTCYGCNEERTAPTAPVSQPPALAWKIVGVVVLAGMIAGIVGLAIFA